jgi:23S rRNA (adenine2503-C2)-methyltransferase
MNIISKTADSDLATVYIAQNERGNLVEFVESVQPPFSREEKWVLIVSTLFGCPVNCSFCDAGGSYRGRLTTAEILGQIDHLVVSRFPDRSITSEKFKIQFSRMGEPSFNPAVLETLEKLPGIYRWKYFIPSLSTIAPHGTEKFFEHLLDIKTRFYPESFQLQFSIHSTSEDQRNTWMPVKKWDFDKIAAYGERFHGGNGRKITLNFAVSGESIIDEKVLVKHFSPKTFLVKLTPVNPTYQAQKNRIVSALDENNMLGNALAARIRSAGYETIISIGETEENRIGSNCGQYVQSYLKACEKLPDAYSYPVI